MEQCDYSHDHIPFSGDHGVKDDLLFQLKEPAEFFCYFLNKDVVDLILTETNRYGKAKKDTFEPLNETEFWKFLAICLHMGIERRAHLKEYWSTRVVYSKSLCAQYISRARFVEILNSLHFANNEAADKANRLYKVSNIIELLNESFSDAYSPGKNICIDESVVPFRGRVLFRQYVKGKRHKYGIKLFKLCMQGGYTCRFIVYAGKDISRQGSVAKDIVLKLMSGLLDNGRSLYTDNFYTSIPLSKQLVTQNTHLIGTLRKNRVGIPKDVVYKKSKRGEQISRQNGTGIVILKWKDKRDVLMLSTKHDDTHSANNRLHIIEDYNQVKGYVDLSDQMAAYTPFVRKTTKWYLRLVLHLITQTTLVNAWKLFNIIKTKISLHEFKCQLIESFLRESHQPRLPVRQHMLVQIPGPKRQIKRRCTVCYQRMSVQYNSKYATARCKRTDTQCSICHKFLFGMFPSKPQIMWLSLKRYSGYVRTLLSN